MKKYLFSDIDGTFLQSRFFSKKRNQFMPEDALIQKAQQFVAAGNEIIFSTGRRFKSVRKLEKNTNLTPNYIISMNGALVYGPDDKELRRVEIHKDDVQALITLLKEKQILKKLIMFTSYLDTKNIVDTQKKPQFIYRFFAKKFAGMIHRDMQIEIESGAHHLIKFVVVGRKKLIEETREAIEQSGLAFDIFKSSPYSLEVCARGANKGAAIDFVMAHKQTKGIIGYVGDSENDISGLKKADYAYAIIGGEPTIFASAGYRVNTVTEAIEHFENAKF